MIVKPRVGKGASLLRGAVPLFLLLSALSSVGTMSLMMASFAMALTGIREV
jgi:hypothetical protein